MIPTTHDARIVKRIRDVLGDAVIKHTDNELLSAYACWHTFGSSKWHSFSHYLQDTNRHIYYRTVARK